MSQDKEKVRVRRRRRRIRTGDMILLIIFAFIGLLFIRFEFTEIAALLFHPVAGLIIFLMIAEFLWLKSSDRTRIYKLEADRLREQRRRDEALLRRARDVIEQAVIYPESEEEGRPGDWRQRAEDMRRDIEERL